MPDEREVQTVRRGASKRKLDTSKAGVQRKFVSPEAAPAAPYLDVSNFHFVELPPAPVFDFNAKGNFATIYMAHYDRLCAVVDAARSGNKSLIRMALAELDRLGSSKDAA